MRSDIGDLHILRDDIPFQPRLHSRREAGLEIEQDLIGQPIGKQVAFHFALGVDEGGVAAGEFPEAVDVVSYLPMQKPRAIGTEQTQARAIGLIQPTCAPG